MTTHYEALGLDRGEDNTETDIKDAYDKELTAYRSASKEEGASEEQLAVARAAFIRALSAFIVLRNSTSKEQYDKSLEVAAAKHNWTAAPRTPEPKPEEGSEVTISTDSGNNNAHTLKGDTTLDNIEEEYKSYLKELELTKEEAEGLGYKFEKTDNMVKITFPSKELAGNFTQRLVSNNMINAPAVQQDQKKTADEGQEASATPAARTNTNLTETTDTSLAKSHVSEVTETQGSRNVAPGNG